MLTKDVIFDLEQRIELQRGQLRRMEYTTIGLISVIVLDADAGALCPEIERTTIGRRIQFRGVKFPLALSDDQQSLLLPMGLPKELPTIPDPRWPGASKFGEKTPYIEQLWQERASGRTVIGGREYLIFRPVETILLRNLGYFAHSCWPKLRCFPDGNGEHMAVLKDAETGSGFIVGGRFVPDVQVRVDRGAMRPAFQT